MCSEIAIKVENLGKCYHIYDKSRDRLLQMLMRGRKQYFHEFWALKNVSFEVKQGETVGIIGHNGSGKSTLLQMICGTLNPTTGNVQTYGRIAALLELGSGFNPEFTGRENIYMNAAVLGLTGEEIDEKYESIEKFSGIADFIDQPVKTYSSGMVVRLAFSVQAQVDPDILIVDEALAVGDALFQAKCFNRLKQLKDRGTSILLVTHSSEQIVTHCSHAILLDHGIAIEAGEPRHIVNRYMDLLFGTNSHKWIKKEATQVEEIIPSDSLNYFEDKFSTRTGYNPNEYRWGDGTAAILDFYLAADGTPYPSTVIVGQTITLMATLRFFTNLLCPIMGITIKTKEGVTVFGANSQTLGLDEFHSLGKQGKVAVAKALFCCRLGPGDYFISLGIATRQGDNVIPHDRRYDAIHLQVLPAPHFFGLIDLDIKLSVKDMTS